MRTKNKVGADELNFEMIEEDGLEEEDDLFLAGEEEDIFEEDPDVEMYKREHLGYNDDYSF